MPKYQNLNTCKTYLELLSLPKLEISQALAENGPDRIKRFEVPIGAGLQYNYAAKAVGEAVLTKLEELAEEQELIPKYQALLNGETMNTGEKRMVLHHLARGRLGDDVRSEDRSLSEFYRQQNERVSAFAAAVQSGRILGSTGKRFDTVVQIGIGGSDLGPRALYIALENWVRAGGNSPKMKAEFISNVDPDDAAAVMQRVDPETTLFVLVSKSGTTQETLTNEEFVVKKLASGHRALPAPRKHMV
ncbi:MAG: glucose-6-phosphate isomerase, partial [Spirochaeta sp.]|nr:glucose-6-phosphate isomerase [Spirochaeta sp.]